MAETLVLAELTIDTRGVVTGMAVTKDALGQVEKQTRKTGDEARHSSEGIDVLTNRMFSLRHAAIALVGSFSLAGLILGIKSLTEAIVRSDEAFKALAVSSGHVKDEFFAVARNAVGVHEGLQEATTWADRFAGALESIRQAQEKVTHGKGGVGVIDFVLFGIPGAEGIISGLRGVGAAMDVLLKQQIEAAKQGLPTPATRVPDGFLTPPLPARVVGSEGAPAPARRIFDSKLGDELRQTWTDLAMKTEEIAGSWGTTEKELARISEMDIGEIKPKMNSWIDSLNVTRDAFFQLADAAGYAFAALLAGEKIDLRGFVRQVLIAVSAQAAVKAIFEIAEGIAAAARYAASYGTDAASLAASKLHYTAARQYFAVSAIAGGAARAFGGGENAGAASGSRGAGGTVQGGGGPSRTVFVYVMGPPGVLNEASFGRYIKDLDRRGAGSNT